MAAKRLLITVSTIVITGVFAGTVLSHRQAVLEWIEGAGWTGVLVFGGIYVLATLLLIPPGILNALSGALFGIVFGMAVVVPANIVAALIGFALSRTAGGAWAQATIRHWRAWGAIDRAVGKAGFRIVFLLRCSPVSPFSVLNYALGLTRVRFRHYALATVLGSLPGTLLYVWVGSSAASVADLLAHGAHPGGVMGRIFLGAGLVATVLGIGLITAYAKSELRNASQNEELS